MKLLIEAKYIPDGMTVYKKTGQTPFIIRDKLNIYAYGESTEAPKREVKMSKDCKFMVDGRGNINIVGDNTILLVDLKEKNELDIDKLTMILEAYYPNHSVYLDINLPQ